MREWARREFAEGRGAQPDQVAQLILRIATGEVDPLSGRHLSVHEDISLLLAHTDRILQDDLCVLRRQSPLE
jgi:hypothetical protein